MRTVVASFIVCTALQAAAAQVDKDLPEGVDYLINMAGRLFALLLARHLRACLAYGFSWVMCVCCGLKELFAVSAGWPELASCHMAP